MCFQKAFSKDTNSLFQNSSLPNSCVSSDPRQRKQSSQTQIQTKTINGVKTETRTETIVKDGITTVNVYINGKLGKLDLNVIVCIVIIINCSSENSKWGEKIIARKN